MNLSSIEMLRHEVSDAKSLDFDKNVTVIDDANAVASGVHEK